MLNVNREMILPQIKGFSRI